MEPTFTERALKRLRELGLALPETPPAPAGLYVPFRLHRGTGYLAAAVPGYGPDVPLMMGARGRPGMLKHATGEVSDRP